MKEIALNHGRTALVDDEDFAWLSKCKWYAWEKPNRNTAYALRAEGKKPNRHTISMHREIMNVLPGIYIDHIDGNGLNNQKKNLRLCASSENQMNSKLRRNSKSGLKGVSFKKEQGKWVAQIQAHKKRKHIGYFNTKEEAAKAYDETARELFGEFANTNGSD